MTPCITKLVCSKCSSETNKLYHTGTEDLCKDCYTAPAGEEYWSEKVAEQERMILQTEQFLDIEELDF